MVVDQVGGRVVQESASEGFLAEHGSEGPIVEIVIAKHHFHIHVIIKVKVNRYIGY